MPTVTEQVIDEHGNLVTITVDGSETVVTAGTNATVTGTGTTADPYVISGPVIPDGAETKVTAGTNATVTGTGTTADPYVISGPATPDGSETKVTAGTNVTVTGTGTTADPYVVAAPTVAAFKELNRFYVDPSGSDSTGTGANEKPYATPQAAVAALGQGDTAVLDEGVYAGVVTMATPNTTLSGASNGYSGLVQIASVEVTTVSGTSNRIEGLTVTGSVSHTGGAPLYLNNVTVSGNYSSSSTAYTEIKDSRIQDGTISKTVAGTLFIRDSLIGNATFSTPNSVIALRNVTIDPGDKVTIGAGVVYSLQDVVGEVEINAAAVSVEQAVLAAGGTAAQAEGAVTGHFMQVRLHTPDTEASPTKILTWDETTHEIEVSNYPAAATGAETKVTAGTNATVTGTGTTADPYVVSGPAPADGSETKVTAGTNVTITGTGTTADPYVVNSNGGGSGNPNADMLRFGSAPPTTNGQHDGEEWLVTTTGDSSGTVTDQYIWDHQTSTWVQRPAGGAGTPITTTYRTSPPTANGVTPGDVAYITPDGTVATKDSATARYEWTGTVWVKTPGGSAIDIKPSLAPVLDMLTTPPATPNDQDSYIVMPTATGAWAGREGDIATWDAANSVWEFKSPANLDKTTVLTGASAGIWQYSSTTDSWTQVQSGIVIPVPDVSVTAGNIKLLSQGAMRSGYGTATPMPVIQNRSVWNYGGDVDLNAGDKTATNSLPRQVSVSYHPLVDGAYVKNANAFPEFVDAAWTNDVSIAIDGLGKVWATGVSTIGTGLTTTPTGTTAVSTAPLYAYHAVRFFQTLTDKAAKVYMPMFAAVASTSNFSMVVMQSGAAYVTGINGSGQLGQGNTTTQNNWVLYPVTNVKYAILGQNWIVVVRTNGDVYFSGNDAGGFTGATGNKTTPVLVATGAATYEQSVAISSNASASTLWVVKADGTLFAGGTNVNGQQGRGNTTTVLGCTQVPGITNAKFVATDPTGISSVALVRTDNTLSFAGLNRAGRHGYTPNASAVANTSFVTPSYTWQGYVAEVVHGYNSTLVRTADGIVYAAGDQTNTGAGRNNTATWTDNNRFKELAIPNPVVGMRGFNDNSTNGDSYLIITNLGSLYGFGSSNFPNKYSDAITLAYSPMRVPFWGDTGVEPLDSLPMAADVVGTITGATPSSVTAIVDGVSNQTVTFTVAYTGGVFGTVNLTGSTVTGADITQVSLTTTSTIVQNGSGTFTVAFVINAADIAALVPPDTQAQSYVLTLLINGA